MGIVTYDEAESRGLLDPETGELPDAKTPPGAHPDEGWVSERADAIYGRTA